MHRRALRGGAVVKKPPVCFTLNLLVACTLARPPDCGGTACLSLRGWWRVTATRKLECLCVLQGLNRSTLDLRTGRVSVGQSYLHCWGSPPQTFDDAGCFSHTCRFDADRRRYILRSVVRPCPDMLGNAPLGHFFCGSRHCGFLCYRCCHVW